MSKYLDRRYIAFREVAEALAREDGGEFGLRIVVANDWDSNSIVKRSFHAILARRVKRLARQPVFEFIHVRAGECLFCDKNSIKRNRATMSRYCYTKQ